MGSTQVGEDPPARQAIAAYARISDDKADDATGVARQLALMAGMGDSHGYDVVEYVDNDLSAYKRHVVRPRFEAMLRDLEDGRLRGIAAPDLDRLWRQPIDLERAIEIYERKPGLYFGTLQGSIDLSTSDGRMLARVMVAAANKSSSDTARRVGWKHAENQQAGRPGGGPRPLGFEPDRITHNAREAEAIRWAAHYLLEGGSVADVVRQFKRDGITTTRGNPFTPGSLRALLRNPRLKGQRAKWLGKPHNRWENVTDAAGKPVQAVWAPILAPDLFDALQEHLDARTARYRGGSRGALKYLLTGIARCGLCGGPMRGSVGTQYASHKGDAQRAWTYSCQPPVMGGCGGVARSGAKVDTVVTEAMLAMHDLHAKDARARIHAVDLSHDIERVERKLNDALVEWKTDRLSSSDYFALRSDLTVERKRLEREQSASTAEAEAAWIALDASTDWAEASMAKRRARIEALMDAVVVHPLPVVDGRKVAKWNPHLIEIVWKDA